MITSLYRMGTVGAIRSNRRIRRFCGEQYQPDNGKDKRQDYRRASNRSYHRDS